jgi:hypothetical protein
MSGTRQERDRWGVAWPPEAWICGQAGSQKAVIDHGLPVLWHGGVGLQQYRRAYSGSRRVGELVSKPSADGTGDPRPLVTHHFMPNAREGTGLLHRSRTRSVSVVDASSSPSSSVHIKVQLRGVPLPSGCDVSTSDFPSGVTERPRPPPSDATARAHSSRRSSMSPTALTTLSPGPRRRHHPHQYKRSTKIKGSFVTRH